MTHSLSHSCLVNLVDVTLACEDGNSKLVKVVIVVEVDDEKRIDNSLERDFLVFLLIIDTSRRPRRRRLLQFQNIQWKRKIEQLDL